MIQLTLPLASLLLAASVRAQDVPHSCYDRDGNPISCDASEPPRRDWRQEQRDWEEFLEQQKARSAQEAREAAERKRRELEALEAQARAARELQAAAQLQAQLEKLSAWVAQQDAVQQIADYARRQQQQDELQALTEEVEFRDTQRFQVRAPRRLNMDQTAAAVAALAAARHPDNRVPAGVAVAGDVSLVINGERVPFGSSAGWGPITLQFGDRLVTGSDGAILIYLPDKTVFELGPNSELEFDDFIYDPHPYDTKGKIALALLVGTIRLTERVCAMIHGHPCMHRHLYVGESGIVGIRGTDFQASVDRRDNAVVELFEGAVDVSNKDGSRTVSLAPGQRAALHRDGSIDGPTALRDSDRQEALMPPPR